MATYYIATTGNDANAGTSLSPWRTLAKGAATAVAGDTVIVKDGTYVTGMVQFLNDGTINNRITFKAENQWGAVISSTSGCNPAFSVKGDYYTIKDFFFQLDATNVACPNYTSANCDIRAWNSVEATPANPTTGWKGFIAEGNKSTAASRAHSIKTNQDDSIIRFNETPSSIEALNSNNVRIHNNKVTGQDENGLSILMKGGCRNGQVYNNEVHNWAAGGYGITMGGDSCATCDFDTTAKKEAYNCVAYNNVVIDEQAGTPCNSLTFMGAVDCAFINNVMIKGRVLCRASPNNAATSVNPTMKNNILVGVGGATWVAAGGFTYGGTFTCDYNNFYNFSVTPTQAHPITGNPLLVNNASDWHLQSGSPCRNSGTPTATWPAYGGGTLDISKDFNDVIRTAPWELGIFDYAATTGVTIDAITTASTENSGASITWAHTVAGTNRGLLVSVSGTSQAAASGVTYNGVAMTNVGHTQEPTTGKRVSIWKLIAPATGTNNIVVSFASPVAAVCGAISFQNVHQTTLTGTYASATGNSSAPAVTVTSDQSELSFAAMACNDVTATPDPTLEQRWNLASAASSIRSSGTTETGAASVVHDWTLSTTSAWAAVGVSVKAATGTATNYTLTCSPGSYALTGNDVSFDRSLVMSAAAGTFAFTGNDAGLVRSAENITATGLTSGSNSANLITYTTASITPGANKLILLAVEGLKGADEVHGVPTVTGNGLTWEQVATTGVDAATTNFLGRFSLFRAVGSSPTAGTVSITFDSTQTSAAWSVVEISGVPMQNNGAVAIAQSATNRADNVTTLSVTMATFKSQNNATIAFFAGGDGDGLTRTFTPAAGFTEIHDTGIQFANIHSQFKQSASTSASTTVSSEVDGLAGIAVELRTVVPAMVADPGSYTMTGNDANTVYNYSMIGDAATYAFTGNDAGVTGQRRLTASAGSYTMSGNVANILGANELAANTGSYTMTGNDASFTNGYTLVAETGSYTFSNNTAGLLDQHIVTPKSKYHLIEKFYKLHQAMQAEQRGVLGSTHHTTTPKKQAQNAANAAELAAQLARQQRMQALQDEMADIEAEIADLDELYGYQPEFPIHKPALEQLTPVAMWQQMGYTTDEMREDEHALELLLLNII